MLAIPGMNPGLFVLGGGGDSGGSGTGDGKGKNGKQGANGKNGGKDANGGGKGADGCGAGNGAPPCSNPSHGGGGTAAGDPVDVLTGRVFTVPATDLVLPGTFPVSVVRQYSSTAREHDIGLGFGWSHSFAWSIHARRRTIEIRTDSGSRLSAPMPEVGQTIPLSGGLSLRGAMSGFAIRRDDRTTLLFHADDHDGEDFRLSSVVDKNGNVTRLTYGDRGLATITDSVGRVIRVTRDSYGRIEAFDFLSARGPIRLYRYSYDDAGVLAAVIDAGGFSTRFAYEEHRLIRHEYPDGLVVRYRYDDLGRCAETWGERNGGDPSLADGLPTTLADGITPARGVLHNVFTYADGYSEVVDSTCVKRYFADEQGRLIMATWGGGVSSHAYDALGNWVEFTDPGGKTTLAERDGEGRMTAQTDPAGRRTEYAYDESGYLKALLQPSGKTIRFERDARGNVLSVLDDDGLVVAYQYGPSGLVTRATLPNGGVMSFEHDPFGNVVSFTEPNGAVCRITHDEMGRPTSFTNGEGAVTRYSYDARGLLVEMRNPAGGVISLDYDGRGRVLKCVDPAGRVGRLAWGGLSAVTEAFRADGSTHRYRYDRDGRFLEFHDDAGRTHRLHRDAAGHVVREETLDGRVHRFKRDAFGRLVESRTDGGDTVAYEYDDAGNIKKRAFGDGLEESFEYDLIGRVLSAKSGDVSFERAYDSRGCLVKEEHSAFGARYGVGSSYDVMGKRTARRTNTGFAETMKRDVTGAVTRIDWGDRGVDLVRDLLGRERAVALPGGGVIEYEYTALGHLSARTVRTGDGTRRPVTEPMWVGRTAGDVVSETRYTWSPAGLLEGESDAQGGSITYKYDAVGQLLARVADKGLSELFYFDARGDMHVQNGATRVHGPGGRVSRKGDVEYVHDAESRLIEKRLPGGRTWRYEWDGRGLLKSARSPDGQVIEMAYDALARRVMKRVSEQGRPLRTTRFVWDGDQILQEILERAAESGDPVIETRTYCYDDRHPVPLGEIGPDGQSRYYAHSPNGYPELLLDDRGKILGEQAHTAYGEVKGEAISPFRHAGQYEDAETGLFYNRHRYYDPELGAYVSPDPLEIGGGLRLFAYANGSPQNLVDPDGLQGMTTTITRVQNNPDGTTTPLPNVTGEATTNRVSQGIQPEIHPAVWNNMAEQRPVALPNGNTSLEFPQATRHPANCSEPHALSEHLYDYEQRNGLPRGTCATDQNHLRAAMKEVTGISSTGANGPQNACPNCGVLIRNLQNAANNGLPAGSPDRVNLEGTVTPGIDNPSARWDAAAGAPGSRSAVAAMQSPAAPRNMGIQPPPGGNPRGGKWL